MDKPEVRFKYIFDDDYEPEYVNGVYGGLNPNGELIINFFMDRFTIPNEIKQVVNEDGTLDDTSAQVMPDDLIIRRVIKNGIVMSPATAVSVYTWLKDKLVEMGVDENEL